MVAGPISRNLSEAIADSKVAGGDAGRGAGVDDACDLAMETTVNSSKQETLRRFR